MLINLKPTTDYRFSQNDIEFAMELAKVGQIHFSSSQITLTATTPDTGLTFKEYSNEKSKNCLGLRIPEHWFIEWIGYNKGFISMTFGIKTEN